jgi:glyoxylase-like metal-dependent hydrolase (beta-lactamase superfamily II)
MAQVKILVNGYTNTGMPTVMEKSCATISLVRDKNLNIVIDPGVLENQKILIDALKKEGLTINDIGAIFITHSHLDHYRNVGMFPSAIVLEYFGIWDKNTVIDWKEDFSDDIKIIKTPGHSSDSLSFFVTTSEGLVAICGDVFWEENLPEVDIYASNPRKLKESRQKVLSKADWIIPGHGSIFKSPK